MYVAAAAVVVAAAVAWPREKARGQWAAQPAELGQAAAVLRMD